MAIGQMRGEIIRAKDCQYAMRFVPHRIARSGLAIKQALRCAVCIGFDRDIDFVGDRFHLGARFPHGLAGFARNQPRQIFHVSVDLAAEAAQSLNAVGKRGSGPARPRFARSGNFAVNVAGFAAP